MVIAYKFLLLSLLIIAHAYHGLNTGEPRQSRSLDLTFTGKRRSLQWNTDNKQTMAVELGPNSLTAIKSVLLKRGEYIYGGKLDKSRIEEINQCIAKYSPTMTIPQALSLRKQLLIDKLVREASRLRASEGRLNQLYHEKQVSLRTLQQQFDFPAVSIFRMRLHKLVKEFTSPLRLNEKETKKIVKVLLREPRLLATTTTTTTTASITTTSANKDKNNNTTTTTTNTTTATTVTNKECTNDKISSDSDDDSIDATQAYTEKHQMIMNIVNECRHLLTERDHMELAEAKQIDQVSYTDEYLEEKEASLAWEQCLYTFLDTNQIAYLKEDQIRDMARSDPRILLTSTPDVIVLDDLYINNRPVRWIDSKNFLGTSLSFYFTKKINSQSSKYDNEFRGKGAIIFRLGFTKDLQAKLSSRVLLLDKGPLDDTVTHHDSTQMNSMFF